MTRWTLLFLVVATQAAAGCRHIADAIHCPPRKDDCVVDCPPDAKSFPPCPPDVSAPPCPAKVVASPPVVEVREAPPLHLKLPPPQVVVQNAHEQAQPIAQPVAPRPAPVAQPMVAPPTYAPPMAQPVYAAPTYAAPTAPAGRSRLGFALDFIRIPIPIFRPIAVPEVAVAPPVYAQPVYAQPVAQPVAPAVYAQPMAQPVYAQPVAQPVYAPPPVAAPAAPAAPPPQCYALMPVPCPPGVAPGTILQPGGHSAAQPVAAPVAAPTAPGGQSIDLKTAEEFCRQVEALKAALEAQRANSGQR